MWVLYGFYRVLTTAEPLDKNRLRIFQPTLGFLSAMGGKYGNSERGYPQVSLYQRQEDL